MPKITIEKKEKPNNNFVPLGIEGLDNLPEEKGVSFEICIEEDCFDSIEINILQNNKIVNTSHLGMVITGELYATVPEKENLTDKEKREEEGQGEYKTGKYEYVWDGFNENNIFDSTKIFKGEYKARIKGKCKGKEYTYECAPFYLELKDGNINWVDIKIDVDLKRIDLTVRLNLKDGGENGVTRFSNVPQVSQTLAGNISPITARTKSFTDLKQLALDGIAKHWGRNKNNKVGKNINIDGVQYEVYVSAINSIKESLSEVKLIYRTNKAPKRSSNPGTIKDFYSFIANIVPRRIFYNTGYLYYSTNKNKPNKGWFWRKDSDTDLWCMETAAHEIGHDVLNFIGGGYYSVKHKGTSTFITQKALPRNPYPKNSNMEIDLMKYYSDKEHLSYINRVVMAEQDLKALINLIKVRTI